jgi:hypothetical protein
MKTLLVTQDLGCLFCPLINIKLILKCKLRMDMANGVLLYALVILKLVGVSIILKTLFTKKIVNFLHIRSHNLLLEFTQL